MWKPVPGCGEGSCQGTREGSAGPAASWCCRRWFRGAAGGLGVSDPPSCAPRCQMLSIGWSMSWSRHSMTQQRPGASRSARSWRAPSARTWTRSSPPRSTWPARSEVQPCRDAQGCVAVPMAPGGLFLGCSTAPGTLALSQEVRDKVGSTDQGHSAGIPCVVLKGGDSSWRGLGAGPAPPPRGGLGCDVKGWKDRGSSPSLCLLFASLCPAQGRGLCP